MTPEEAMRAAGGTYESYGPNGEPDPADSWQWSGYGKSDGPEPDEANKLHRVSLPHLGRKRIPPRQWAYGKFLLFGHAAALAAVDGGGKGAIAVVMALAMITGRPLLGEQVWRKGPVAIVTYEDDQEEWHRRIAAACEHYGIDYTKRPIR